MEIAPFVPIIVEATKFLLGQAAKWIDHARQRSGKNPPASAETRVGEDTAKLADRDLAVLESNLTAFVSTISAQVAEVNAYLIEGLVEQIKTHHKNLIDLEKSETEFGPLTPQHIKRGIEREASAIVEKSTRLGKLLEQVHGKSIKL